MLDELEEDETELEREIEQEEDETELKKSVDECRFVSFSALASS